jgi:hypothetical protein
MTNHDEEPALDIAHGDQAISQHLRSSLKQLRERSDNTDFKRLVDDVLAGRASLRDVYTTPAFAAGVNPGVERFAQRYEQLNPEERAELAEQGRQALQTERDRLSRES